MQPGAFDDAPGFFVPKTKKASGALETPEAGSA